MMLYSNQSQTNVTVALQYESLLLLVVFSTVTTVPCCVFLYINGVMLFTLRSKTVFRETSRYILLYNLLFADTVMLVQGQLMFLLSACRLRLTYPVCGFLVMLANLTNEISPLTLVVMSVERFVAVCYPLRHATIITIRNTAVAVVVVWTFSSVNVFVRVVAMVMISIEGKHNLLMKDFCGRDNILFDPIIDLYDTFYTYSLFVLAGVAVASSYIGVMVAARSASTDKASARKARKTLLLHLVQLGLSLSSTVHNPLLFSLSQSLGRVIIVRIQIIIYVCIIILPRCLSSLIYGLRDQTIRPVLVYNLCHRWRRSGSVSVPQSKQRSTNQVN